jgi:hypothetical protein
VARFEYYSIIVFRTGAVPPDVSRSDVINIQAPWDLVEGLAKLALARYPGADRVIAVDNMGHTKGEWNAEPAHAKQGRVIRVTPKDSGGAIPRRQLFAVPVGDDQQALAHFKDAFPELDAVIEVVGELSEFSLEDLGLKAGKGKLVPL